MTLLWTIIFAATFIEWRWISFSVALHAVDSTPRLPRSVIVCSKMVPPKPKHNGHELGLVTLELEGLHQPFMLQVFLSDFLQSSSVGCVTPLQYPDLSAALSGAGG